ncbi:transglutaminase domain-containing protein [Lewinella sp. LCG006]|uniref:transglutaminase domain-containing protein n=1 Tax=Lewinella sp. LCG006 TaxID=3231911 RepID=UPI0034609BDB
MRAKFIALLCFLSTVYNLQALDSLNHNLLYYASVSRPTEEMTLASLASTLESKTTTKLQAAEIAFYWITEHISYDFEGEQFAKDKVDLQEVLRTQRGNFQTFSQFYQELCRLMGIDCYLVTGYVNYWHEVIDYPEYHYDGAIKDIPDHPYHAWNLVKIDGVYYGVDISLGSGAVGGDEVTAEFVKKIDLEQVLVKEGMFFRIHLPADPRWQMREYPILLKPFHTRIPYEDVLRISASTYSKPFDYKRALHEFENASPATQRLMSLQGTYEFNPSDFNIRQVADAHYNLGYTQSSGVFDTQRLLAARKSYEQAIDAYRKIESTPTVQQLMAQAQQGITYINYRLDKKQ